MTPIRLVRLLQLDAAVNLLAGAALVLAATTVADPLGLTSPWPLRVVGVLLLVNGVGNLIVANRPARPGLAALAAVDIAFAAVLLLLAATGSSAETWARWALVVVADVSLIVGGIKLVGRRRLAPQPHTGSLAASA